MTARTMLSASLLAVLASMGVPVYANQQFTVHAKACIEPPPGAHEHATDELMKYKIYTRETIEPAWRREMLKQASSLWFGEIKIRCVVHSDGTLTGQTLVVGESASPLFKNVCINALKNAPRFKPFSDALVKQVGLSFTDDFDFTITSSPQSNDKEWQPARPDSSAPAPVSGTD